MAKVKISKEKMSELFTMILSDFGDLIRTPELKWGVAEHFIKGCEDNGVTFEIDEDLFPKNVRQVTTKPGEETETDTEKLVEKEKEAVQATFEEAQKAPATITGRDLKDKGDAFNKFLKKDKKVKTNKRTRK